MQIFSTEKCEDHKIIVFYTNACFCILFSKEPDVEKKSRLTIDMTAEEHMYLKLAATQKGVSMKDFILSNVKKAIDASENNVLQAECDEVHTQVERTQTPRGKIRCKYF